MINLLEFIFVHSFLIFKFGFIAIWEYHCTYILSSSNKETESTTETTLSHEQTVPESMEVIETFAGYTEPLAYESSILTDEQSNFFDNLFSDVPFVEEQSESVSEVAENDEVDELLSMELWQSETPPVEIAPQFTTGANSKINAFVMAEQVWTVEVIGEEQGYIHVSDGTGRAWIDATQFNVFQKGDILSVLVNRASEICVELLNAEILQRVSSDFSMDYSDSTDEYTLDDRIGA